MQGGDLRGLHAQQRLQDLVRVLAQRGRGGYRGEEGAMRRVRWVTHLDVRRDDVERAIKAAASF